MDSSSIAETPFFQVCVKSLTEKNIFKASYDESTLKTKTIVDLKVDIEKAIKEGYDASLAPDQQKLFHCGTLLLDNAVTLNTFIPFIPKKTVQVNSKGTDKEKDSETKEEIPITFHLFYYDPVSLATNADPIESAIDWDSKNRIRVSSALYEFSVRNFEKAASLFIEALPSFVDYSPAKESSNKGAVVGTSGYISSLFQCSLYAIVSGAMVFDRSDLKTKLLRAPEVLESAKDIPEPIIKYITDLYECKYNNFLASLEKAIPVFQADWLMSPHTQFIAKEMRIRSYRQALLPYKAMPLTFLAASFGVSVDLLVSELSRFIATGRIACKIDLVKGVAETASFDEIPTPKDIRSIQFETFSTEITGLLDRVQQLTRIVSNS